MVPPQLDLEEERRLQPAVVAVHKIAAAAVEAVAERLARRFAEGLLLESWLAVADLLGLNLEAQPSFAVGHRVEAEAAEAVVAAVVAVAVQRCSSWTNCLSLAGESRGGTRSPS